jgi:hypothetical protein
MFQRKNTNKNNINIVKIFNSFDNWECSCDENDPSQYYLIINNSVGIRKLELLSLLLEDDGLKKWSGFVLENKTSNLEELNTILYRGTKITFNFHNNSLLVISFLLKKCINKMETIYFEYTQDDDFQFYIEDSISIPTCLSDEMKVLDKQIGLKKDDSKLKKMKELDDKYSELYYKEYYKYYKLKELGCYTTEIIA